MHLTDRDMENLKFYTIASIITTLLLFIILCTTVHAYTEQEYVRAIIGEASGEGYNGMLAVACAIRNRGTLKGVYGLNAKHINKQPRWIWDLAYKAWIESIKNDITNGATHWESDLFKEPYWAKTMLKTVKLGHHQFYR